MAIIRRIPWNIQPPYQVENFDQSDALGRKCIFALIPGWGYLANDKGLIRSVGQKMEFVGATGSGGGGGSTDILPDAYGRGVGSAKAMRLRPSGATTGYYATRADADLGIIFPNTSAFTVVAVVRTNGDGVPGGGDPRVFMKGSSWSGSDHDLMLGMLSNGKARARIRINSSVVTVFTSSTLQSDSLNVLACSVDPRGAGAGKVNSIIALLREDGSYERAGPGSGSITGTYNPRTSTSIAIGATAGATSQFFDGDIICICAFSEITDTREELQHMMDRTWRIFEPRLQYINTHVAAGGTTFTGLMSGQADFATAFGAIATRQASTTAPVDLTATLAAIMTTDQAITSPVDLTEAAAGIMTTDQGISAPVDLAESLASGLATSKSFTAPVDLADGHTALIVQLAGVSEAVDLTDSTVSIVTAAAAISEAVDLGAAWAAIATRIAATTAPVDFGDAWVGELDVILAAISEDVTLTAAFAEDLTARASLTAPLDLLDVQAALMTAGASFSESVELTDAWSGSTGDIIAAVRILVAARNRRFVAEARDRLVVVSPRNRRIDAKKLN